MPESMLPSDSSATSRAERPLTTAAGPCSVYPEPQANLLDKVAAYMERDLTDSEQIGPTELTVFDAAVPPAISLRRYLQRLAEYACCSPECFTLAAVFARRSGLRHTRRNLHRLLLAGVVVAAKWHNDWSFHNKYYAEVGGVLLEEVNRLELALLQRMEWRLCTTAAEFNAVTQRHLDAAAERLPTSQPGFNCLTGTDPLRQQLAAFTAAAAARTFGPCSPGSSSVSSPRPRHRRLLRREPAAAVPSRGGAIRARGRCWGRSSTSPGSAVCSPLGSCGSDGVSPGMLAATGLTADELNAGELDTDIFPPGAAVMPSGTQRNAQRSAPHISSVLLQGLRGPRIAP